MGTTPDFDEWVAARGQSLLRLAYALTGSAEAAEEIVEDALLRALPRWSHGSSHQDHDAHLRRLVIATNASRSRRVRRRGARGARGAPQRNARVTTGVALEDHDIVWRACRTLPPDQRTPIVLRFYEGLDYAEIADMTGVREGIVRSRVSHGIAALQVHLGRAMTDVEGRLRDSLAERAEDAPTPTGLAGGARSRLRRRRTTVAKCVGAATTLAAVPFAFAFLDDIGSGRPTAPVAPDAAFVVPDRPRPPDESPEPSPDVSPDRSPELSPVVRSARATMQEVTWRGIRFLAPSQWRPGATTAWCAKRKDPAAVVPRITLPDNELPKIECTPTNGYGVTVESAAAFVPVHDSRYVWEYDAAGDDSQMTYPDGTWLSQWYEAEWVVTIATPDPGLTSRIAQSVRGAEVDANGCALLYDDVATRTAQGPRGVGAALCRYSVGGELDDSQRLTYVEVDRALEALEEAPDLPDGEPCAQEEGWWVTLTPAGGSAYLARYGTQGAGSCQDGVETTAQEDGSQVAITSAVLTAFSLGDLASE